MDKEGPEKRIISERIIPEHVQYSCISCKFYKHQMVQSGRDPIYSRNCNNSKAPYSDSRTGNLSELTTPSWCPFLTDEIKNHEGEKPGWSDADFTVFNGTSLSPDTKPNPKERFLKPTDDQFVELAIIFNDGNLDNKKLVDMVAMCEFVVDRLYENGDVMKPSLIEETKGQ